MKRTLEPVPEPELPPELWMVIADHVRERWPVALYALRLCSRQFEASLRHWRPTLRLLMRCHACGNDYVDHDCQFSPNRCLHNAHASPVRRVSAWGDGWVTPTIWGPGVLRCAAGVESHWKPRSVVSGSAWGPFIRTDSTGTVTRRSHRTISQPPSEPSGYSGAAIDR